MRLASKIAALTAVMIGTVSFVAIAESAKPPVPRPAAGALPQDTSGIQNKNFRVQTAEEQKASTSAPALGVQQSSRTSSSK
jgi:hypothetical protein